MYLAKGGTGTKKYYLTILKSPRASPMRLVTVSPRVSPSFDPQKLFQVQFYSRKSLNPSEPRCFKWTLLNTSEPQKCCRANLLWQKFQIRWVCDVFSESRIFASEQFWVTWASFFYTNFKDALPSTQTDHKNDWAQSCFLNQIVSKHQV